MERQLSVVERQFPVTVVERQTQVAQRRSGPFRPKLITGVMPFQQRSITQAS